MKNIHWLIGSIVVPALAACTLGQSAVTSHHGGSSLEPPTGDYLVLSNATGTVRVLDSKGLVLEKNLAYLPRIPLADLSTAELRSLLETKTAYAGLTMFESVNGTNEQSADLERQLHQTWHQRQSLAERIQTRLEILEDLRDYNIEIALLPASIAAANQYAVNDIPINNQFTNRAANTVVAAAEVESVERYQAAGVANAGPAAQQALPRRRRYFPRTELKSASWFMIGCCCSSMLG